MRPGAGLSGKKKPDLRFRGNDERLVRAVRIKLATFFCQFQPAFNHSYFLTFRPIAGNLFAKESGTDLHRLIRH